jgi:SRSO17 transposase
MERMREVVPEVDYQSLQHFTSHSPWDDEALVDQVAHDVDQRFAGDPDTAFIIDESGFAKKGKASVGVARQWIGRLGKVDNGQVGVFAALSRREEVSLVGKRLFLPESWVKSPKRCRQAGIPEEYIVYRTKADHALAMVRHARANGIRFRWVGADSGYGKDPSFLRQLEDDGEMFLVDVHKDQRVYLDNPSPTRAQRKGKQGRHPTRLTTDKEPLRVDAWAQRQPESAWQLVTVRDSTRGWLRVKMLHRRVWLWDGKEPRARCWHLLVRQDTGSDKKTKYSLSNAPAKTSVERLAFMQAQRFWVERALQDGKSEVGMSDYQVRGWRAWHHHMALVMLAMLFMLETRAEHKNTHPLLSCSDIQTLLSHFLPRRDVTKQEVLDQMELRHKQRAAAIDSAHRKQVHSER